MSRGGARARGWCFTINGFQPNDVLLLREKGRRASAEPRSGKIVYLLFGRELGAANRRRHIQGYVYFQNGVRLSTVKKEICQRAHVEVARGSPRQNYEYCTKDGDWEEYGRMPCKGKRNDLELIKEQIKDGVPDRDIAEQHFSRWCQFRRSFHEYRKLLHEPSLRPELKVFVLVGAAGVGKTRYAYESGLQEGAVWMSCDPTLQWFDGYNGQKHAILDDFRGGCSYEWLLRVLDLYPLRVPIKGSFVHWEPQTIWITSNTSEEDWFPDQPDLSPLKRRITKKVVIHNASCYEEVQEFLNKSLN